MTWVEVEFFCQQTLRFLAFVIPSSPVTALAMAELTMMACATPPATTALSRSIGAAATLFVVKTPATAAGTSERMSPKSSFWNLSSACVASAVNPFGEAIFPLIALNFVML